MFVAGEVVNYVVEVVIFVVPLILLTVVLTAVALVLVVWPVAVTVVVVWAEVVFEAISMKVASVPLAASADHILTDSSLSESVTNHHRVPLPTSS